MILLSVGPAPGALVAPEISRELAAAGHEIVFVLQPGTEYFIGPAAFAGHAQPACEPEERPDAVVLVPVDAAELARLARGLSEGSAEETATDVRPVVVAPGLDAGTARHPAVRENLALLRDDGWSVLGEGEIPEPAEVVAAVLGGIGSLCGPLAGLKVVVSAGGTREPIDAVRFVGNRSSGRMGLAVAREAQRMGAEVTVVAANVGDREPGVRWADVETVAELERAVRDAIRGADALVMAAAVSDFTPAAAVEGKIRRGGEDRLSLELVPTADVLAGVREENPGLFVVGFAATHGDPVPDAREKLRKKGANLIVGNDVSRADIGFESGQNEVYVVGAEEERFVPRASKEEVARAILEEMVENMKSEGRI